MRKLSLLLLLAAPAPAFGQATWTTIGNGTAYAMNADGTAVVGEDGGNAFLWTMTGGQNDLGETNGRGVSADGTVVAGNMTDGNGDSVAGRWTLSTGWVSLGGLAGQSGSSVSTAYAMSGNGTIVGLGWENAGQANPFRYTTTGGMTAVPYVGINSARASGVSLDGDWIAGFDEADNGPRRASIWDSNFNQTFVAVTGSNPDGLGEAWGFSENNTYVVGSTEGEGYVWSQGGGLTKTGTLPSTDFFQLGEAYGVSNDGQRVVGFYRVAFPFDNRATLWTPGGGLEELKTVLEANGAVGVPNLSVARAISADGLTILASDGFVWGFATLPPACGSTSNYCIASPNSVDNGGAIISASGSLDVDDNAVELAASPVPNDNGIFFYGAAQTQTPFGNGFLCIDGTLNRLDVETASNNTLTHQLDITDPPTGAGGQITAGSTWFFQAWYRDPAAGGSNFNLSDGLEIMFCN